MPKDYIVVRNDDGEIERIAYEELDSEIYPQLWRPIGGFCYSVDSFVHLDLPPLPFYIQSWLPKQGKAVLYAPAKSGKSYLCAQIARCIGAGDEFLGIPTSPGRVLYVQCELGESILKLRLQSTGQDYDNVFVGTTFDMKLDSPTGQRKLVEALDAILPNVLIIDNWSKVIHGDENESTDTKVITDFLDSLIEAYDEQKLSIFIIAHPGKDISKGARGSSVLEGWVDSYIEMKRISDNGEPLQVKITPKLYRHAELPPEGIKAEMRDFEFVLIDGKLSVKQKIVNLIETFEGELFAPKRLIDAGIGTNKQVHTALDILVKEGKVEKVDRGVYQLKVGNNGD